jgi:hypothetical protein
MLDQLRKLLTVSDWWSYGSHRGLLHSDLAYPSLGLADGGRHRASGSSHSSHSPTTARAPGNSAKSDGQRHQLYRFCGGYPGQCGSVYTG